MEAQHPERKNRIKLRVLTSTGLNLLCTANRSQKVKQLLPHIIKLYEEVKEDQGLTDHRQQSLKPFIKFIRKQEFLIAPSQLVGDIFDDNDQVFCQIADQTILNINAGLSKKQREIKEEKQVKTQNKPPKTKKIKKKSQKIKQQSEPKKNQKSQKPVQKTETIQQKIPQISQKMSVEVDNNPQIQEKVNDLEINKTQKQNKKKKNKNNNNQPSEKQKDQEKGTQQKVEKVTLKKQEASSKTKQTTKAVVKKENKNEQKSAGPLLSNDQLAKFRLLMKKSVPTGNDQ